MSPELRRIEYERSKTRPARGRRADQARAGIVRVLRSARSRSSCPTAGGRAFGAPDWVHTSGEGGVGLFAYRGGRGRKREGEGREEKRKGGWVRRQGVKESKAWMMLIADQNLGNTRRQELIIGLARNRAWIDIWDQIQFK
eukprot:CAMPEP_0183296130 /NCGR_PEP_ID=MMETSP0160_2-20130417/3826_1 /TAXON_ID=2839 ORGANISM="Odontella Sinensis, Strain Grunow 1884" /NCGR_SAMPLE_ID=MMETSP0160_2 /ASSEMBLY_ACC=CAM_ASM_000250 /LENGTH=140 /DNA_ID=CAMNT_0025457713 /DNA_START=63 /DNA_END=485 /DNA_ORIENTATION=-